MRAILNISVPQAVKAKVDEAIITGKHSTASEFFRALMRLWEEQELAEELIKSRKAITKGQGKILRSLKGLR